MNKIIRSAYGSQVEYQDLSQEAIEWWIKWNREVLSGKELAPGLSRHDRLYINNGTLCFTDQPQLAPFELDTIQSMKAAGLGGTQLVTMDPEDVAAAERKGLGYAVDPFRRLQRNKLNVGVLDTTGGLVVADKACRFALHKARLLGVKFIFNAQGGAFDSFWQDDDDKNAIRGVRTRDGRHHPAVKVIMACGGWTPSILPQLDHLCETTAGSVIMLKIPPESPLRQRFSPDNFPSWMWKLWEDGPQGGLYGFPVDDQGWMKIGYRGTKYTNPQVQQADGNLRSVPVTRYTPGLGGKNEEKLITQIPRDAMVVFKRFLAEYLPELAEEGIDIALTRLCWYTDSFDNHYVVDDLPDTQNVVMVATGGCGHAFKYLPILGNWVVDIMEGQEMGRALIRKWRWRTLAEEGGKPFNVLMQGTKSPKSLGNVLWTKDEDLKLGLGARL